MSATTANRPPPNNTATRRSPTVSGTGTPNAPTIPRGATARAAASPRLASSLSAPGARRGSVKAATSPVTVPVEGSREALAVSLKAETEEKEKLLLQLQDKDQTITSLRAENDNVTSSLHTAETRLAELYGDQTRMEEEMAGRIEVIEKLRSQVRELEKEKRDSQRRYNEQTASFEAERQAFYDNEQHLKSRIQSLSQARKQPIPAIPSAPSVVSFADSVAETEPESQPETSGQEYDDPEQEPAEMTALRLELSTLLTSHSSIQSTLHLLQSQLNDLKRVNNELQEENESYNILLRERTLTGQYDIMRMGGNQGSEADGGSVEGSEDDSESGRDEDSLVSRETARSTLDPVHELAEEAEEESTEPPEMDPQFNQPEEQEAQDENEPSGRSRARHSRKRSSIIVPHGESLANLPITGPGLDLAAELGRAENKDILDGRPSLDDRTNVDPKQRKHKKGGENRKVSAMSDPGLEPSVSTLNDIDALRSEVKSLKDANKALSLYASKIIDRIISQEGFEHVLAVDWDKPPSTPATATAATISSGKVEDVLPLPTKKARPQSVIFSRSTPSSATTTPVLPPTEKLTTFESLRSSASPPPVVQTKPASSRASRRSLSFDWRSFSMFNGTDKKPEPSPQLRPLTLKAGTVVTGGRKLETQEDDEDRKERERLNATMKLMGIDKPEGPSSPLPPMLKSFSSPGPSSGAMQDSPPLSAVTGTPTTAVAPTPTSRFSFFRRSSSVRSSETSSINSSQGQSQAGTPNLTQEALEQADAEATIAALEAHERQLSAEIAKGSGGGFTEIVRRSGDRRSSRRSGSGSTVFSAGMSTRGDED
ncbi:hypothetical protein BDW22DRAFT_1366149 [Trametopsis cervina]|nr:hypothetical protein BDW22DRAFT_1366149 [Trametopsis cervina]